ncbi:uncharacterized protein LOC121865879 [Homarus americanus]|uniref:Uncharacterized protein n=1 Tax=Homarus americanus TaxID=6706 RepID=A0A8J5MZQ6_HOMAM|nr:uncharacterized protein LOC121865879 [Homarus americanus]KAG7169386.1 hypothetical protein Hamer_G024155 [Homarus americanus]
MATPGEHTDEGAASLPLLCPKLGEMLSRGRGLVTTSTYGETLQTHTMVSTSSSYQSSASLTTEPVSILGKGRHHSSSSISSSSSPKHSVKFTEPEGAVYRDRAPESPRFKTVGQEKIKYQENFKFKVHDGSTSMHRNAGHGIGSIPEKSAYSVSESSNYRYTESSKLVGTSYRCPDSPRNKTRMITRTPDRNSIIASMELKVPSFHDLGVPSSGSSGGGLTPLLGHPESRGLTILSPHNPTPELHFSSTFTVRTRKGKTIVLPKLRIPAFHSHSHDSIFLG